jgi:hypothetical protein
MIAVIQAERGVLGAGDHTEVVLDRHPGGGEGQLL